jgi:DNA-binding Lrp family transcriptional regulator
MNSSRKPKFSNHEKKVLAELILDGRLPCTKIGERLGISSQAVGRIITKLEGAGIIKGYSAIVDYEKLGIEVLGIAMFRFKSGSWTRLEEQDIMERVKGPHLLRFYRVTEGDVTHMVIYGFRSLKELDNYFHVLQTERGHISELKKLYILSITSVLKDSPNELLLKELEEMGAEKMARPQTPKPLPE